jgi:hypothetical protein
VPASLLRSLQTSPVVSRFTRDRMSRLQCSALIFFRFQARGAKPGLRVMEPRAGFRRGSIALFEGARSPAIIEDPARSFPPAAQVKVIMAPPILGLIKSLRALHRGVSSPAQGGILLCFGRIGHRGRRGCCGRRGRRQEGEGRRAPDPSAGFCVFVSPQGRGAPRRGTLGERFLAGGWRAPLTRECSHIS